MRRISITAALAVAATLALTGGTAAAKPKAPGLGDRVEIRFHKNGKLRTINGLKVAHVKVSYRCAPSPNLELIANDVDITQRLPGSEPTGAPGSYGEPTPLCNNRWQTLTATAETSWWNPGSPPFRKGPAQISVIFTFADFAAGVSRQGNATGKVVLR